MTTTPEQLSEADALAVRLTTVTPDELEAAKQEMEPKIGEDGKEYTTAWGDPEAIALGRKNLEHINRQVEAQVNYHLNAVRAEQEKSRFERLLSEMENRVVQPVLLDNAPEGAREWFLCKISFEDVADLAMEMSRYGYGIEDIADEKAFHLFKCAFLYVGVVVGRDTPDQPLTTCNNTARYFTSAEQVMAMYTAKGLWAIPEALYTRLKMLNPGFVKDTEKKTVVTTSQTVEQESATL